MQRTRTHRPLASSHTNRPFFSKGSVGKESAPFFSLPSPASSAKVQSKHEVDNQQEVEEVQTKAQEPDMESAHDSIGEAPLPPSAPPSKPTVQTKLTVQPNDRDEQGADYMAGQVGVTEPTTVAEKRVSPGQSVTVQRLCSACEKQKDTSRLPFLQTKLEIGQPNDEYEQEADRVAEQVMRMPETESEATDAAIATSGHKPEVNLQFEGQANQPTPTPSLTPTLQRECEECKIDSPPAEETEEEPAEVPEEETETTPINPKVESTNVSSTSDSSNPDFEDKLKTSKQGGVPLVREIRRSMEHKFDQDFSHVRIHTGSEAASMNRSIQAKAFTHENHIFFNQGRYSPNTKDGQQLLAHELTHIVQQTGSRAIQPKIQRDAEIKLGDWAHDHIQDMLRSKDKKLITEAPIPGGTRNHKRINSVGFADLYKAEGQVVSGISAQEPKESKVLKEENAFYKYVNMRSNWLGRATPVPSPATIGPKIKNHKKDLWDFSPNFPSNFEVGEIKPLFPWEFKESLAYHGLGITQAGNYREGFEEFVKRVYKDNPKHQGKLTASINGRPLKINEADIPDTLNYKKFEQEHQTLGKGAKSKSGPKLEQRLWVYNQYKNKHGVLVYFLVPHPYKSTEFPKNIEDQLQKLDPILLRLRKKHPKMTSALQNKRESPVQKASSIPVIHRKPVPKVQAKEDWNKLGNEWEVDRKNWVRGQGTGIDKPKKFLKEQAKGVEKKAKIDDELGVKSTDTNIKKQITDVKKIRFWSSFRGRLLGALRFRFGVVFEKLEDLFQKIKEKFKQHHKNSDSLNKKGGIFDGWKKVATRIIIQLSVEILKQMLVEAFTGFVNCINGVIDAILEKFTAAVDEMKQELAKQVEPICCEVMSFKKKFDDEYTKHETMIASFTEAVETIQKWREILDYVETAIRIGVQVVSCATPPALGCLWGLVAQVGISAGLSLLSRTDYFKDEIARPAAKQLMDAIVGDSLHNFLIEVLEKIPGLKSFIGEAKACQKRSSVIGGNSTIGGNLHKLDPNNPEIVKIRQEWEKEHEAEILRDLQAVFEKGKGKKVTKEDLQKLIELIQKGKKSPEETKQMLEAARNAASGKLKLETASTIIETGELPKETPEERKIDYEKATRSNKAFQQIIGWKPFQFYKKPGVKADSEEFAEAIYDMQKAIGIKKADGMLGEDTVIAYYEKNNLKKDSVYQEAVRIKEKGDAEKEKATKEKVKPVDSEPTSDVIAVRVNEPPANTSIISDIPSSPGWISIPFGVVEPELSSEKTAYDVGENLNVNVKYWIEKQWVWFTNIPAKYVSISSLNGNRIITVLTVEDFFFKLTNDSKTVYAYKKGKGVIFLDVGGLL